MFKKKPKAANGDAKAAGERLPYVGAHVVYQVVFLPRGNASVHGLDRAATITAVYPGDHEHAGKVDLVYLPNSDDTIGPIRHVYKVEQGEGSGKWSWPVGT